MKHFIRVITCVLSLGPLAAGPAIGQERSITFKKIVDTDTLVPPESVENFLGFFPPSIDEGNVAFFARNISGAGGIYAWIDGELIVIADLTTPLPDSDGTFKIIRGFGQLPSIDEETVAFLASGRPGGRAGVYTGDGGPLMVVVDSNTEAPPAQNDPTREGGTFINPQGLQTRDDGMTFFIAFSGENLSNFGVYKSNPDKSITVVADLTTPIPPDGNLTFGCPTGFCNGPLAFEGVSTDQGNVAFTGGGGTSGSFEEGNIFKWIDGDLIAVLPPNPEVPGTGFPIRQVGVSSNRRVALGGRDVAFVAGVNNNIGAIVAEIDGKLETITLNTEPRPGGGGAFQRFNVVSIDNGNVAFETLRSGVPSDGIFLKLAGEEEVIKIATKGDLLDGKVIERFRFGQEALNGNEIALSVEFDDGSQGVFVASFGNQPPVADAGPNQDVECTSPSGASVTLDGSGSSDPDGDPLTYVWSNDFGTAEGINPIVVLPLGSHEITLIVNDGQTDSEPATVTITVKDTTAPGLAASLTPVGEGDEDDDDDEGRFRIDFSAGDACDSAPTVAAVLVVPGIADIPVADGQVIEFELDDDETEVEFEDGILEIEAPRLTLRVTGTDASGNAVSTEVRPAVLGGGDDGSLASRDLDD